MVVAEIQQTSDITYRIYDFDRVDAQGNSRELHVDLALDAINYEKTNTKKEYDKNENKSNEVVNCKYFTTNFIPLDGLLSVNKTGKSFTVFMCVDGTFQIEIDSITYQYQKGDTILIPAALTEFKLIGKASVLEIYIS
jgi:mannose-6-phosphate isomerase